MFYSIDKIFVLGLLKNKKHIEHKFNNLFSFEDKKKVVYHYTEGVGNNSNNDGSYNANLKQILAHNTNDAISRNIFQNHINIIEQGYLGNYRNIMILEDDAIWDIKKSQPILTKMNKYILNESHTFDILYLGYCNYPYVFSAINIFNPSIVRPFSPLCAHGYVVNREGLKKILYYQKLLYPTFDGHIDKFFSTSHLKKKALYPQVVFQQRPPALFVKACDLLRFNKISFNTMCVVNENLSVLACLVFYGLLFALIWKGLRSSSFNLNQQEGVVDLI